MIIQTKALRKSFRTRKGAVDAVRGVDLAVAEGEIFGFLGAQRRRQDHHVAHARHAAAAR